MHHICYSIQKYTGRFFVILFKVLLWHKKNPFYSFTTALNASTKSRGFSTNKQQSKHTWNIVQWVIVLCVFQRDIISKRILIIVVNLQHSEFFNHFKKWKSKIRIENGRSLRPVCLTQHLWEIHFSQPHNERNTINGEWHLIKS